MIYTRKASRIDASPLCSRATRVEENLPHRALSSLKRLSLMNGVREIKFFTATRTLVGGHWCRYFCLYSLLLQLCKTCQFFDAFNARQEGDCRPQQSSSPSRPHGKALSPGEHPFEQTEGRLRFVLPPARLTPTAVEKRTPVHHPPLAAPAR